MSTRRALVWIACLASVALVLAWGAQAFGSTTATHGVGRWLAPISLLTSALAASSWARRRLRTASEDVRRRWIAAAIFLVLGLAVRLAGIDHEVGERAYLDEGTYVHHAQEINAGKPWRWSFVYGHVSYYAGAFGLWLSELYPSAFAAVATAWAGTSDTLAHQWLVLRLLVGLLSAATVLPVFAMGYRICASRPDGAAPQPADALTGGSLAALLFVLSPLFNEGSHLIISDYPSACLATFCLYFVLRIGERVDSSTQPWAHFCAAGAFAGLAAATKYPAGTVAVAIVFVWAFGLWTRRQFRLMDIGTLSAAGAAAIATFIGSMPTFVLDPVYAVTSPRGMLFGLNQYAKGGWIGVMPTSQARYYLELTAEAIGWAALLGLISAPFLLAPRARRLWLLTAFYPAFYIGLLLSMNMVVKRNLAPAVPALAVLAGVGGAALAARMRAVRPRHRAAIAVCALLLVQPAWATTQQIVGFSRDSTREQALRWMVATFPRGTRVFRESYTPALPPDHFFLRRARFAARVPLHEIERDGYQYVLLARNAFQRFLDEDNHREAHHAVMQKRYLEMFERYPEVRRFEPTRWRRGPTLLLLEVVPAPGVEVQPVTYDDADSQATGASASSELEPEP